MTVSSIFWTNRHLATTLAIGLAIAALGACGKTQGTDGWDGSPGSSSGGGSSSGQGSGSGGGLGNQNPLGGDGGGIGFNLDATVPTVDAGTSSSSSGGPAPIPTAMGTVPAADCPGCNTFPGANAAPCAASAPAIKLIYPNDTVLIPPNMNVISVHWTPFGPPYSKFSVDFSNVPNTDWHIVTSCKNQTIDAQGNAPSGGCEVVVDPLSWSKLVAANRGGGPVTITVRGTTDGTCATSSTNQIHINFAEEDLLGTYYYWKSTISANGVGGQIWKKTFGDLNTAEADVTSQSINATCSGCHSLSRDGTRMVVYSDDDDSDDEYSDVAGSYLDMTMSPAVEFPGGVTQGGFGTTSGQPPGFSTVDPTVTIATSAASPGYYLSSNGVPCVGACPPGLSVPGYPAVVPSNGFSLWNGTNGAFAGSVTVGAAGTRPTMPDWSPDGKVLVYVVPAGFVTWPGVAGPRSDDDHLYGGSLYTVPYTGTGTFGAPAVLLQSGGENNYYPSYSPDVPMSYIIFNRVDNMKQGAACAGGFCPDDSFSNPAARLVLLGTAAGAAPIDLEKANGSPVVAKVPWSNSYPRWAPFVQTYHGQKLLWFTFSSTRDYGVRVLDHKTGMYQCYPSDAAETPGGRHRQPFAPQCQCQEPQLWMAPINLSEAQGNKDPSRVAFWIPYQDITTHNHTAQWTQQHAPPPPPPPDAGVPPCKCQANVYGPCGVANGGCDCCMGTGLVCTGSSTCFAPPH